MFKIYSYKAFKFERKEGGNTVDKVDVPPMTFTSVPDWVRKTALFKWAADEGSIVETKGKAEENTEPSELDQLKARAKELKVKSYGNMGIQRLREAIAEAEAELESGNGDNTGDNTGDEDENDETEE